MRWSLSLSAVTLALALAAPVCAASAIAADVQVKDGWFRALPAGLPAGGYMELQNTGASDAVLTGASSPACGMLMLHKSMDMGGMSRMEMVDKVTVPAHGAVAFKPGSYHLMCMQPDASKMKLDSTVPVTLEFSDGGKIAATFKVLSARGK